MFDLFSHRETAVRILSMFWTLYGGLFIMVFLIGGIIYFILWIAKREDERTGQ